LIFPGIYILSIRIGSSILQTCWVIHPSKEFGFNIKNWSIFTGDLPILKFKSWPIFTGDLPFSNSKKNFRKRTCFLEIGLLSRATYLFWKLKVGLFSQVTYPFQIPKITSASVHASLKLAYFHVRPTHFEIQKPIYFDKWLAFSNSKKNFNKHPCFLKIYLFSWTTCLFWNLKKIYFHGWLTLFKFQKKLQQASILPWN